MRLLTRLAVGVLVAVITTVVLVFALVTISNAAGGTLPGGVELLVIIAAGIVAGAFVSRRYVA